MRMKIPKVSVIMPTYNAERYLRSSINSILNQTYQNFELIIIDDCSTDATPTILEEYSEKDDRVKTITNRKNLGPAKSRNKGIKMARGKYIAVQDSDDISLPERLERQVEYLERNKDVVILGTSAYIIDDEGEPIGEDTVPVEDKKIRKILSRRNCLYHGSVMFHRKKVESLGFYREKFKYAHDLDLYLRVLEIGKINNLPESLYINRLSFNSFRKAHMQRKFSEIARRFARERREKGIDSYNSLDESKILAQPPEIDPKIAYRYNRCMRMAIGGDPQKAKKGISALIRETSVPTRFVLKLWVCYILTLLSMRSANLLKKIGRAYLSLA